MTTLNDPKQIEDMKKGFKIVASMLIPILIGIAVYQMFNEYWAVVISVITAHLLTRFFNLIAEIMEDIMDTSPVERPVMAYDEIIKLINEEEKEVIELIVKIDVEHYEFIKNSKAEMDNNSQFLTS